MMTLKDVINVRKDKHDKCSRSDWWDGYVAGWKYAYQDLEEILEQNGFDMNVIVMKEMGV